MKVAIKFIKSEMPQIITFIRACDEIISKTSEYSFTFIVPPHYQVPLRSETSSHIIISPQKVRARRKIYDRTFGGSGILDGIKVEKHHETAVNFITKNLNIKPINKIIFNSETNPLKRIGFFSTWNIRCGIAVYTKHLSNALRDHGYDVFNYPHNMDLNQIRAQMSKDGVQVLFIQHEPSIMPDNQSLTRFITKIRSQGIKVGMTFHSNSKIMETAIVDFCIFHKQSDDMKSIRARTFLIPMSVPIFDPPDTRVSLRQKYGYAGNDKIISTVGFAFKWKKYPIILSNIVPLLLSNRNIKLQMITSINDMNPSECVEQVRIIEEIISTNKLQDQVICLSKFIPQEELSERLFISDLGYLWSGISTTSSSAAGKEFITARVPLVITNSNHYHDLTSGVVKTEQDELAFSESIMKTILDSDRLDGLRIEMENLYNELNYNTTIQEYINACSQ